MPQSILSVPRREYDLMVFFFGLTVDIEEVIEKAVFKQYEILWKFFKMNMKPQDDDVNNKCCLSTLNHCTGNIVHRVFSLARFRGLCI